MKKLKFSRQIFHEMIFLNETCHLMTEKRKELRKVGENTWQGKISFEKLPRWAS